MELGEKGDVRVSTFPLTPKHDMRRLAGSFAELTSLAFYEAQVREDYLEITLTDKTEVPGAFRKLQKVYPNLLSLRYEQNDEKIFEDSFSVRELEETDPFDLVSRFFEEQAGKPIQEEQAALLKNMMADLWGGAAQ